MPITMVPWFTITVERKVCTRTRVQVQAMTVGKAVAKAWKDAMGVDVMNGEDGKVVEVIITDDGLPCKKQDGEKLCHFLRRPLIDGDHLTCKFCLRHPGEER